MNNNPSIVRQQNQIRRGIFLFGAVLFLGLLALRWFGIERRLLMVLGIASLLLVLLLLITYRALVGMAEEASKAAAMEAEKDKS